jgi:parallel beta-helix repeat protein
MTLFRAIAVLAMCSAALGGRAVAQAPGTRAPAPTVELRAGLVITQSVRVARRTYALPADAPNDSGVVVIRGDDITVDFGGATLEGMPAANDPDLASGVAIRVEGGRNVRIVNLRVRGYKVGILARGTTNLVIERVDASHNWKPRLFSLVEHESLVDWLSFHHNERDEWLRFGAAFYLDGVHGGAVRDSRAEQGMNALLMVATHGMTVSGNDFSFNSGLGVGLYRSTGNTIVRNRIDFDVRGYSHGFYHRGQDSSGLLLYEQSNDNVIAYNTGTHSGDGFFLWAGQSTMDTGGGGANDNWVVANDFSWSPANGIEATFSRNAFIGNRLEGNDYGVWGGYSFNSSIAQNCFIGNRVGVAIEHGQENAITGNAFLGDTTAVWLWGNPIEPSDWVYPKKRDTKSRGYSVEGNRIERARVGLRVAQTSATAVRGNVLRRVDSAFVMRDTSELTVAARPVTRAVRNATGCPAVSLRTLPPAVRARIVSAGDRLPRQPLARRDRSAMIVDEWGPFDWRSPKLWPVDSVRRTPVRLRVAGPAGKWRVAVRRGIASLSRTAGSVGDTIVVTPSVSGDWSLDLEYMGGAIVTPRGESRAAGMPYRFGYERFEPAQAWTSRFYTWTDTVPRDAMGTAAERAMRGTPMLQRTDTRLDYFWSRPAIAGLPRAQWALAATTAVTIPDGTFSLRTISDDAARVWVDGRLVIDRWTPHESTVDYAPIVPGRHDLRVEYFQVDGWVELRLDFIRGAQRSSGSAGPH